MLNKDILLGLARHVLTIAGGALVAKGVIDAGIVEQAVGALVTLIGVGLSIVDKKKR